MAWAVQNPVGCPPPEETMKWGLSAVDDVLCTVTTTLPTTGRR